MVVFIEFRLSVLLVFRLGFRYFSFPKHIFSFHDIVYIKNTLKSSVEFAKISRCAMSHEKTASLSENLSFWLTLSYFLFQKIIEVIFGWAKLIGKNKVVQVDIKE